MPRRPFVVLSCVFLAAAADAQSLRSDLAALPASPVAAPAPLFPSAPAPEKKSRLTAVGYSLLLPGMGELYAGAYDRGRYFTIADGVTWLAYAAMLLYGHAAQRDAHQFAADHAGAVIGGKDDPFYTNVGNFTNTAEYNDKKARDGSYTLIYGGAAYAWQWDADANRADFRTMLVRANGIVDGTKYLVAAAVANRFLSAIDAVLMVNRSNARLSAGLAPDILGYRILLRGEIPL